MLNVDKILTEVGLQYTESGDDYLLNCWYHEEKHPSMRVDKETGVWHCFSCHRSGNILTILYQFFDIFGPEAILFLQNFSYNALTEDELREKLKRTIDKRGGGSGTTIQNKRVLVKMPKNSPIEYHPYLEQRGITVEETIYWNMGVTTDFPYKNWIVIPIYFKGFLRNYFLRSPELDRKLYGPMDRSDIIFGYDDTDVTKPCIVTEGIIDTIFTRRIGIQSLAALSNRLLPQQIVLLRKYPEVTILHDNDANEAGLHLIKCAKDLLRDTIVSVATLPIDVKDPADTSKLSISELKDVTKNAYDNRIPLLEFIVSDRYKKWVFNGFK